MSDSPATLEVAIDGATHSVPVQPGEVLLEAMEAAGIDAPFSCRAGCCATCMCTLVEGEVELLNNNILEPDELDEGWILGCQAIAKSERVKIRFPDGQ